MNQIKEGNIFLKTPLGLALLAFLFTAVLVGFAFFQATNITGGFSYALDDSFIMMAISRNLALHGVWGLTSYEFSSTASSPLFTVLLAGLIKVFGDHILIPLVVNILSFFGLLVWLTRRAAEWKLLPWQTWLMLMGLILLAPIPVLLFGSMEHILHLWIALICLYLIVEKEKSPAYLELFFWGLCLGGIRYEGLFEGGLLVLYLWSQKRWVSGFIFGFAMVIPASALGFYSMSQGWFFLPNSLLLKAFHMNVQETGNAFGFLYSLLFKAAWNPHAIAAMFVLYLARTEKSFPSGKAKVWINLVLLASLFHFLFGRYSHVYRYEAYLMGMTWIVFWRALCQSGNLNNFTQLDAYLKKNKEMAVLILILIASPLYRSIQSYAVGARGMVNIYEQQVQTGWFVKQFYNKKPIAAIDIGALAYYTDSPIFDLWGLGTLEIAKLKIEGKYDYAHIGEACKNAKVEAVIYYGGDFNIPEWKKVASWTIKNNQVCAEDTIDFYGINDLTAQKLLTNLRTFELQLPKRVLVTYYEMNSEGNDQPDEK